VATELQGMAKLKCHPWPSPKCNPAPTVWPSSV